MYTHKEYPKVRVWRPAAWCVAALGTIYLSCAAYEVHHDAARARAARRRYGSYRSEVTLEEVDHARHMISAVSGRGPYIFSNVGNSGRREPHQQATKISELWKELSDPDRLAVSIVATNAGIFGLERLFPVVSSLFSHVPASQAGYYTLLTSTFGHAGVAHIALNMYGIVQFLPPVAQSSTFTSSGSHLAAFYLSSGILSTYAFHLASLWPRLPDRIMPVRGASGAVMALVGAFGTSFPHSQLGIILVPGSLDASQFLVGLALFETYGLFVGIPRIPLAHAAHLAGLAIGSAYVCFDGRRIIWLPIRRWVFRQMQRLKML